MISNDNAANIGVAGFSVQLPSLLPGIFQTFGLYLGALELGRASSDLQWQLRRAEQKLASWAVVSGWSSGYIDYSIKHQEDFILLTIRDILTTQELIGEIMTKHGFERPPPGNVSGLHDLPPFTRKKMTEMVEEGKAAEKRINKYRSNLNPRKYVFPARDEEELAKLVNILNVRVSALHEDLSLELKTELSSLYRNDDIDEIERMNKKSIVELCLERDRAFDAREARPVDQVVTSRGEGRLYVLPDDGTTSVRVFLADQGIQPNRGTGVAKWNEQRPGSPRVETVERDVLVELRLIPSDTPAQLRRDMQEDFETLCKKLSLDETRQHNEMRVLQALGLKEKTLEVGGVEKEYFCLTYSWPRGFQPGIYTTLYDALTDVRFRPPLEDRLQLALQLVKTSFRLSTYSLLHKALRSTNIVFLERETATGGTTQPAPKSIQFPYLCGFEYSRSVDSINLSLTEWPEDNETRSFNDLYRHPACLGGVTAPQTGSFNLRYDMYSLGIILCEIGQWAAVDGASSGKRTKALQTLLLKEMSSYARRRWIQLGTSRHPMIWRTKWELTIIWQRETVSMKVAETT